MYDEDNSDKIINHHTYGLVINFIGGEPFMNIDTIEYATKYFLDECLRRNHIWLTNSRFNISTNGMLYFTPKVLNYIKQFHNFLSLNISIDGPQELHDACRIDYQNNGSFEAAMKALKPITQAAATINNTSSSISGMNGDRDNYEPPLTPSDDIPDKK